jgi:tRNA nucleotidyltransferase (CCA-adding enzyme)
LIRAVGDSEARFKEDPLRLLRAIRLAAQLDFSIEPATWVSINTNCVLLGLVAIERIRDEFVRLLLSANPKKGLELLRDSGLLEVAFPEIYSFVGFEQNRFHKDDLFDHSIEVVSRTESILTLRLAALLHDIGKPATLSCDPVTADRHFYRHESVGAELSNNFLDRLRFSKSDKAKVHTLVHTHMRPLDAGQSGLRRLLRDTEDLYPQWRQLKEADASSCKMDVTLLQADLKQFDENMKLVLAGPQVSPLKTLAVNGNDIISLGVEKGPDVGNILRALHEKVLDDPQLNTKEVLLRIAKDELL